MIAIRPILPDDWPIWRKLRLMALGEAPYAFGSKLSEWQDAGEERWRDRLASVDYNAIAEVSGMPAGMVSGARAGDEAELLSMWVAPFARGKGVGDALVAEVLRWASLLPVRTVVLSVTEGNAHAMELYRRHDFVDAGPGPDAAPGERPERRMVRRIIGHG